MSSGWKDAGSERPQEIPEQDFVLREAVEAFRLDVRARAERPAAFWTAQRAAIRERVATPLKERRLWALGSVFAMIALAVAMLMFGPAPSAPVAHVAQVDDDVLMQQVYEATSDSVPDALAPTLLLANEVDQGLKSVADSKGANNR